VQGFEDRVIRGGEHTVSAADAVISEVSFVSMYDGQPLFNHMYKTMSALGFSLAGMVENTCHPRTGEIMQSDAIFLASDPSRGGTLALDEIGVG
jgi:hypothetical protein